MGKAIVNFHRARYFCALMKPGILRLLVLTTICTMLVAQRGVPAILLMFWTLIGTTLVCGSANAINMVWDRDIDALMKRTSQRPLVLGHITPGEAILFSVLIGTLGLGILYFLAHPMAAFMGLCGHFFYVVIYTMILKRRTSQNIVIGGAAGAFPPLIGWAAVTGSVDATGWLIFGIIFLWTPPHFWALALYKDIEYGKANVPMLPVVAGHAATKLQMLIYLALLLIATGLLGFVGPLGIFYTATAVLLGGGFLVCCLRTAFTEGDLWPKRTFAYSIVYLALLFGAMSFDSVIA
jgi:heme o synthase